MSTTTSLSPDAYAETNPGYRWVALSNTTLGMLMATINTSIVIISLPAIFRGIDLDPLEESNVSYLLWIIMSFLVVSAVLVVSLGRLGDIYGRVRMYNLGFAIFTGFSILLSVDPFTGDAGALWLIAMRVGQGIGGALIFANSSAILTDAFPLAQRGFALGVNQVAAIAGSFLGLIIGGVLSEWHWRAVFWVSVPLGILGTIWGYRSLVEIGERRPASMDLPGNLTFAAGLTAVLVAITYGIQPYGGGSTGWTNPWVIGGAISGLLLLALFLIVESRVATPMVSPELFRNRSFALANLAGLLAAIGRGGLQFMLIIWLQGIWLPLHGYDYEVTPLWAGIYMVPLTIGFLISGPVAGILSDRYGTRRFAVLGAVITAATFLMLLALPLDFSYPVFALVLLLNGLGSGLFTAPNAAAVMNAVPADQRGAASGVRGTVFNSGNALSIGIFFSLLVAGLAGALPRVLSTGLIDQGVPTEVANDVAALPPVGSVFATFLGYNPIENLLEPSGTLTDLPAANVDRLTGNEFFPRLMTEPFHDGLVVVFAAATLMMLIAGLCSWLAKESTEVTR